MALTPQEQQELAQLKKEVAPQAKIAKPKSGGLSPLEQAELDALKQEVGGAEVAEEGPSKLRKVLDYGIRALDYPGGFLRTGLASSAGLLAGKGNIVTKEDLGKAAMGQAPTSAEYLERLGVEEGPSAELPILGKTSTRDALGLGLDIASDPLTAIGKAAKSVPYVGKILNPAGKSMENLGKATYKSGLKKVDERLVEKGAQPISDLLLKEGKTGTTRKLAKDAAAIEKRTLAERSALYKKASELGAKVDLSSELNKADLLVKKIKSDPGLKPMAEGLEELIGRYKEAGKVDLATASEWKTNLYNALPESAYQGGKVKGPAAQLRKVLANDFKNAIVKAGNKAEAGLGDSVNAANEVLQTTISAEKPLKMQIRRGETPNYLTSVDAMLGAGGFAASDGDVETTLKLMAAKKAADLAKTTYTRTKTGKGLVKAGESGLVDPAMRRGLINANKGLVSGED